MIGESNAYSRNTLTREARNSTSVMNMPKRTLRNERPHNFDSSHSWIMLLPSRQRKQSSGTKSSRNVVSGLMMLAAKRKQSKTHDWMDENLSPFQEFTGYKFFTSPTKVPVSQGNLSTIGSSHNSLIVSTETRDNTAVDLSYWSEKDPDIAMMPSRESGFGFTNEKIPEKSVAFTTDISDGIPTVIHVPLIRSDSRLIGEDILCSDDEDEHSEVSCGYMDNGLLNESWTEFSLEAASNRQFMFPPRSKHKIIQHDTTWGITTATLEEPAPTGDYNGEFQQDHCVEMVQEERDEVVHWPSDEEKSNGAGNIDFFHIPGDSWSLPDAFPLQVSNDSESAISTVPANSNTQWARYRKSLSWSPQTFVAE